MSTMRLYNVGAFFGGLSYTIQRLVFMVINYAFDACPVTHEQALKEINTTGHAIKREAATVSKLAPRHSRNSAALHVSMLTAINGVPAAA